MAGACAIFTQVEPVTSNLPVCPICSTASAFYGRRYGALRKRDFDLHRCPTCHLAFVANPWIEFNSIYSESYYSGKGADPLLDYVFELEHPDRTIRRSEWKGILKAVNHLHPVTNATRWMDYGCGNGGPGRYPPQKARRRGRVFEVDSVAAPRPPERLPPLNPPP